MKKNTFLSAALGLATIALTLSFGTAQAADTTDINAAAGTTTDMPATAAGHKATGHKASGHKASGHKASAHKPARHKPRHKPRKTPEHKG